MARQQSKGTARYDRARKVGWSEQLRYESEQRDARDALKSRLAKQRADRMAGKYMKARDKQAAAIDSQRMERARERGMNAGTMGRSRL